jgi:hypothetical protein
MKKQLILILSLLTVALLFSVPIFAQPSVPPTGAPIDGGLSLLVAAGVGYGAKKLKEKRKKEQEDKQQKN